MPDRIASEPRPARRAFAPPCQARRLCAAPPIPLAAGAAFRPTRYFAGQTRLVLRRRTNRRESVLLDTRLTDSAKVRLDARAPRTGRQSPAPAAALDSSLEQVARIPQESSVSSCGRLPTDPE